MLTSVSNPRAPHPSAVRTVHEPRGAGRRSAGATDPVTTLAVRLARLVHGLRTVQNSAGTFERIDGAALQAGDFRASDSLGLDGAPAMAFTDTMPSYSRLVDRPFGPDAGAATVPRVRAHVDLQHRDAGPGTRPLSRRRSSPSRAGRRGAGRAGRARRRRLVAADR